MLYMTYQHREGATEDFTEMFLLETGSKLECGSTCSLKMTHHNCTSFHFDQDLSTCHCGTLRPKKLVITDPIIPLYVSTNCPEHTGVYWGKWKAEYCDACTEMFCSDQLMVNSCIL